MAVTAQHIQRMLDWEMLGKSAGLEPNIASFQFLLRLESRRAILGHSHSVSMTHLVGSLSGQNGGCGKAVGAIVGSFKERQERNRMHVFINK